MKHETHEGAREGEKKDGLQQLGCSSEAEGKRERMREKGTGNTVNLEPPLCLPASFASVYQRLASDAGLNALSLNDL